MGNMQESANFVREIGDTTALQNTQCKRLDTLYFKSTQTLTITAIGLCSPISEKAVAEISIYETQTEKELLSQTIHLDPNRLVLSQKYDLKSPVEIVKNKFYTISIEVYGGAIQTYLEARETTTHGFSVIEVTRDDPQQSAHLYKKKLGVRKEPSDSSTSIMKLNISRKSTPNTKTSKAKQTLNFSTATSSFGSTLERAKKTNLLRTASSESRGSPTNLDSSQASTPKSNKKSKISPPQEPATDQFLKRSKSQFSDSETASPERVLRWRERAIHMNLVTGFIFKRNNLSVGCC